MYICKLCPKIDALRGEAIFVYVFVAAQFQGYTYVDVSRLSEISTISAMSTVSLDKIAE